MNGGHVKGIPELTICKPTDSYSVARWVVRGSFFLVGTAGPA